MQPNELRAGAIAAPLLTYSLTTEPMPVQVSLSSTSPSIATLTFVVSCPKKTSTFPGSATVAAIEIILPVDTSGTQDPANLCLTAPPLSSASISSSGGDVWIPSDAGAPGAFYFMPQAGSVLVAGQSLTIEFTGIEVNTLVGTALVTINEWAVPGSGTPPTPDDDPPSGQQLIAVAKFPYGFYAGNFTSNKPMVNNGEKPVLSWTGSANATYLMLYESNPPVDVSNVQSWSPPNGLTQMTTFILQVSAQQAGQTATMDFSLTIEVANPSLTAQDLTVLQASNLKGPVNVGASGAAANLMVNGNVQSQGTMTAVGALTAQSIASILGGLSVGGATTLQNALTVQGNATLMAGLSANGNVALGGPVSLFGQLTKYGVGTRTAPTDGLVIGAVWVPNSANGPYYFNSTITGTSGGISVAATGGGWVQGTIPPNYYGCPMSGTFILPVRKGNTWTVGITPPWSTSLAPLPSSYYAFWWIPLGVGAMAASLDDFALSGVAPAEPPMLLDSGTQILMPGEKRRATKKLSAARKPVATKRDATKKKPTVIGRPSPKKKPAAGKTKKR